MKTSATGSAREESLSHWYGLGAEVHVEVFNPASVCSKGLTSDSKLLIFYLSVLGNGENGTTVARGGVAGNKKYYILRVRVSCEEQSVKDSSGQFLILVFRGDDDEASEVSLGVR